MYGVKSKTFWDLPDEDSDELSERQMKRLALMFGLPGGRAVIVVDLRPT